MLIATRGRGAPDITKGLPDQVQVIDRGKHSAKPEAFREIIDKLYTTGTRIELFRRGDAPPGWSVWGNEVAHTGVNA
jgi:N6-adenosine-specific RNA methylase IME4